ncbi:hypothetical protein L1049_012397 [Liquidambar formosana]|uniref:Cytochrome P450 n=1 Tax=Liquidambar formosana TaxID=63359 RepID=A0AAP0R3N9_LIQFO
MKTHDLDCCSRPPSPGPKKLSYNFLDVAFSPYGSYWREIRKLFNAELLSPKRAQSLWYARKDEVNRLITSISKTSPSPCNLNEMIFSLADSIVGAVAFGKSYGGKQFQNQNFQDVLDEAVDVLGGFSAEDFFPSLIGRFIDALRATWMEDPRITKDHIKAVMMDTSVGGIDTSSITIVWAMSELVKNPRVLNKVQAEIRGCVGKKAKLDQDDLKNLKYLKMVVKELSGCTHQQCYYSRVRPYAIVRLVEIMVMIFTPKQGS